MKGKITWNKGLKGFNSGKNHWTYGKKRLEISEDRHWNWKGDKVGYRTLHKWVENKLGKPNFCEHCRNGKLKHRQYQWANVSGDYKRLISDWRRLCVKCHKAFDSRAKS